MKEVLHVSREKRGMGEKSQVWGLMLGESSQYAHILNSQDSGVLAMWPHGMHGLNSSL